jgi:SAM-dependent methyltransferase
MPNHHEHHHHHHHHDDDGNADLAELLDLDAEVLHGYLTDVMAWVHGRAPGRTRRILDLGAGTGAGALALAQTFADAQVIAVDVAESMLARLAHRDRIRTVVADLDTGWPAVGEVDLVWAANSMHHLADPDRVLGEVFGALVPGGLLALAEMDSFPRFLPDHDLGSGLEARCHAALAEARAADMPNLGSDWAPRLRKAGFAIEAERQFVIDVTAPLPAAAGRYAQASLRRLRSGLADRLAAADLAALDRLTGDAPAEPRFSAPSGGPGAGSSTEPGFSAPSGGPGAASSTESVLHRPDLRIRAERTVWAARRP